MTADASASTDPDGIASYRFDWGDDTSTGLQTAPTATHTYTNPGTYTLTVTVTDSGGLNSSARATVKALAPGTTQSVDVAVVASSDDAEESAGGSVSLTSSDLELVNDGSTMQTVGVRFANVAVPAGATITRAYAQFQTDEVSTDATSLTVRGVDVDSAGTFTTASRNVSSRPRTDASVQWMPASWPTVGARGPDQATPDLSSVVQEIVTRPGWASGNALALVITGSGRRTAEAFDGTAPPQLHVEFAAGPVTNRAPVVNAGADQTVVLPNAAALAGSATDDGLPNPPGTVTSKWTTVSGTGTVTFADPSAPTTTATFSAAGTYVLRLTASDSTLSASDDVTVTTQAPPGTTHSLDRRVAASSDDAEERVSNGAVSRTGNDLELVTDGTRAQVVGLRFTDVTIPKGALITEANLKFQTDEVSTDTAALTIRGHAADNPPTFGSASFDISQRPTTTAAESWSPVPTWPTVGASGNEQTTPDLKAIVQEIVARAGWGSGNAMAFVITRTGRRTAEAYDGTSAPALHIDYKLP